ncbi:MAG: NFACT RNA binding domain-containing protein, partial [Myxococcota bacterium]
HLRFSCRSGSARVSVCERVPRGLPAPGPFVQYLRAHGVGARVSDVRLVGEDRQLALGLGAADGDLDLLLAIFGRRSNVILLDKSGCILSTLRPLAQTRPELAVGHLWRPPASAPPPPGKDRFSAEPDAHYLEAIEAFYAEDESRVESEALRRRLARVFRKRRKNLDRKLEKLDREIEAARLDTDLERRGELLKGVLSQVRKGQEFALARDYATGEEVSIPLDATKTPSENLSHIFKRFRRAVRALSKSGEQHDSTLAAQRDLDERQQEFESLDDSPDAGALEAFAARPAIRELLTRYAPEPADRPPTRRRRKAARDELPARLLPRRYRTEGGLEIWVGRSDAGNDHLSTRLARGNDLFFHLDGAPGSHVVLRTEGRSDPPSGAVLDACELAVNFSKLRAATRADVHVVPIKNVKKPKGAKPGLVFVHGGKTVHLRRSPGRLQRLLAARID